MSGKVLKIALNDFNGTVDERKVVVFACFLHTKYMNNYVIFAFENEYNKKKLCYGSIYLKEESLVIFAVKDSVKQYINEFIDEYMSDKMKNFEILDIDRFEKVEIVSYSEMDFDNLQLLDDKSIVKIIKSEKVDKKKKPIFLYILIFILVLFSVGLTLLYFYPEIFTFKYKELVCTNNLYDSNMMMYYDINKDIRFDKNDKVQDNDVVRTYTFLDSNIYYEFKENNNHEQYFSNGESYKYIDEQLSFKIFYQEDNVIDDYNEMLTYLNREGYSCIETEYEK